MAVGAVEGCEDASDFVAGENDRQPLRAVRADQVAEVSRFDFQHIAIEKDQGTECLRLGTSRDVAFNGQIRQEGVDFRGGHLLGMTFVVEEDEAFGPIVVTIFGTNRVMAYAAGRTEPVEQFRLLLGCLCGEVGDHVWNRNCAASECQTNCVCGLWVGITQSNVGSQKTAGDLT